MPAAPCRRPDNFSRRRRSAACRCRRPPGTRAARSALGCSAEEENLRHDDVRTRHAPHRRTLSTSVPRKRQLFEHLRQRNGQVEVMAQPAQRKFHRKTRNPLEAVQKIGLGHAERSCSCGRSVPADSNKTRQANQLPCIAPALRRNIVRRNAGAALRRRTFPWRKPRRGVGSPSLKCGGVAKW